MIVLRYFFKYQKVNVLEFVFRNYHSNFNFTDVIEENDSINFLNALVTRCNSKLLPDNQPEHSIVSPVTDEEIFRVLHSAEKNWEAVQIPHFPS